MKAKELMIDDWCKHSLYGNIQIKSICNGYMVVEPIPLTPEILKKKGFKIDASMRFLNHEEFSIEYSLGDAYTRIFYEGTIVHKHINYVHELQHALRLCGLNDLADNFEVEQI